MRLYRLIAILLLIESRGCVKARELAQALETSPRTIYRDIEVLCQAGLPIAATTGPNGGVRFMQGYTAGIYNLRGEDAVNLYLSGAGMLEAGGALDLKDALKRLEQSLPPQYRADIRAARERFYFDDTPWWGAKPAVACMEELRRAVWALKKLRIRYGTAHRGGSERVVRPYGLVLKAMDWYLAAYCEQSSAVRTFKCERIACAEMLDEPFSIPADFDLERYWRGSLEVFRTERQAEEHYRVWIRLPRRNAWLLDQLEVYETVEREADLDVCVNMHSAELAKNEALDIAWLAEVVSPEELREHVVGKARELSALYSIKE